MNINIPTPQNNIQYVVCAIVIVIVAFFFCFKNSPITFNIINNHQHNYELYTPPLNDGAYYLQI